VMGQGFYYSKPVPPAEIIALALGGVPAARATGGAFSEASP
jgi:hypothetical protein